MKGELRRKILGGLIAAGFAVLSGTTGAGIVRLINGKPTPTVILVPQEKEKEKAPAGTMKIQKFRFSFASEDRRLNFELRIPRHAFTHYLADKAAQYFESESSPRDRMTIEFRSSPSVLLATYYLREKAVDELFDLLGFDEEDKTSMHEKIYDEDSGKVIRKLKWDKLIIQQVS